MFFTGEKHNGQKKCENTFYLIDFRQQHKQQRQWRVINEKFEYDEIVEMEDEVDHIHPGGLSPDNQVPMICCSPHLSPRKKKHIVFPCTQRST